MAEYIEKQAAFDAVKEVGQKAFDMGEKNMAWALMVACEKVRMLPAADVQPVKHGRWIIIDGCAYCSNCRNNFKKAIMTHSNYCPMCGVKMDLQEEKI